MSDKTTPDTWIAERTLQPPTTPPAAGVTLSWPEAFRIVPELAEAELARVLDEFEQAKAEILTLRSEILYATNRARNCEGYLREVGLHLGTGNFSQAAVDLKRAVDRLAGEYNVE